MVGGLIYASSMVIGHGIGTADPVAVPGFGGTGTGRGVGAHWPKKDKGGLALDGRPFRS
jgi:hypothetical protein